MIENFIDYSTLTIPYEQIITRNVGIMEIIENLEDRKIFVDDSFFKCIVDSTISTQKFLFASSIATELRDYLNFVKDIYNIELQEIIISAELEEELGEIVVKIRAIVFAENWELLIKVWKQAIDYLHEKYNENLLDIDIILTMNP